MVFASPVELQAALANELGHPLLKRQRILATLRVSWYLRLGMFNKGRAEYHNQLGGRWFHFIRMQQKPSIPRNLSSYSQMMTDDKMPRKRVVFIWGSLGNGTSTSIAS